MAVTLQVTAVLERLAVRYVIGGSLASAMHGTARATMDADLVVDLQDAQVAPFVAALQADFYVDEMAARQAVARHSSFNLIHFETMFKVDLFVAKPRAFDEAQLANRRVAIVSINPERKAYILSAEDTILAKLEWYRLGNEQSERQWRDVRGILRVQGSRLDLNYMREAALGLGVGDLLRRLIEETG